MNFFYIKNKINEINRYRKKNGSLKIVRNLLYIKHSDEMKLIKDLDVENKFTFIPKMEVVQFEKKHMHKIVELCKKNFRGGNNPNKIFENYLKNNTKGFIAKIDDEIIGYIWWGNNKLGRKFADPDFKFYRSVVDLKEKEAYIFDAFLDEVHRGSANAIEFFLKVFSNLKKLGYKRVVGFTLEENRPARWTYRLLGFKEGEKFNCRRFLLFFLIKNKKILYDPFGYKNLTI